MSLYQQCLPDPGYEQAQLLEEHQLVFVVKSIKIAYLRPAYFNDSLEIKSQLVRANALRLNFRQEVFCMEVLLAEAAVTVVSVNARHFKPMPVPAQMLAVLTEELDRAK